MGSSTDEPYVEPDVQPDRPTNAKNIQLMNRFLAFRDKIFASSATDEEKDAMWKTFLAIYTGTPE